MDEIIKDFKLAEPLTNDNSGFSKWGIATRDRKKFFLKQFLNPVYPVCRELEGTLSCRNAKTACEKFVEKRVRLYEAVDKCSGGNIIRIKEFFRYGSKYYIATDYVKGMELDKVLALSDEEKTRLCKVIADSLRRLHRAGIVHGDIKLSNIIFKKLPSGCVTAKMIDFDSCFFKDFPPVNTDDIEGDQVYAAPETVLRIINESGVIDEKIDVFAAGLLFHQIFCGELPSYDKEKYQYPSEVLINKESLVLSPELPQKMQLIIKGMIASDPNLRPDAEEVFRWLSVKTDIQKEKLGEEQPVDTSNTSSGDYAEEKKKESADRMKREESVPPGCIKYKDPKNKMGEYFNAAGDL